MKKIQDGLRIRKWQSSRERRELSRRRVQQKRRSFADFLTLDSEFSFNVKAPEVFLLEDAHTHSDMCRFLSDLRKACHSGDRVVIINFRRTRKIYAGAMLLFYAELQRLLILYPHTQWDCIPSRDDTVNQVLKFLGIYSFLGYDSKAVPRRKDVVTWRHASDTIVDAGKSGGLIELYKDLSRDEARHTFRGVAEATTNVVHHAYIGSRDDGLRNCREKRWWMFCHESENSLYVAICDLGVGISGSLPVRFDGELITKVLSKFGGNVHDGVMIQAAIELARTRTNRKGRGKGLGDLKRVVDEVVGTRLYIFSNKGLVEYWGGKERVRNFHQSIKGTLIVWIIPLKGNSSGR